jgi:serine/threonine protein kinase
MPADVTCHSCRYVYPDSALFCPNCGTAKVRPDASDELLGKVLAERFLIQERIGQGTSGTIYRGEHVTLRRKVAIKVLHHELSRDDLAVERFRREATSVAELDNEHIVEIHDFGRTSDGRLYLAMELLEGVTLDAVLARDGRLSFERAADILIQVGEALMEAHAIGYVHRDLRPRNIFLSVRRGKANFIKLLDFGLSKLVEGDAQAASTSLGMTFGDPRYMSPEAARGDRIDRRADIYQLGCIAYEMLTGAPPFVGAKVFDVLSKQVTEAPAPLPSAPARHAAVDGGGGGAHAGQAAGGPLRHHLAHGRGAAASGSTAARSWTRRAPSAPTPTRRSRWRVRSPRPAARPPSSRRARSPPTRRR